MMHHFVNTVAWWSEKKSKCHTEETGYFKFFTRSVLNIQQRFVNQKHFGCHVQGEGCKPLPGDSLSMDISMRSKTNYKQKQNYS